MRVLVSIFAALLILISLYQLSFTWFVNRHENAMEAKAMQQVKRALPAPEQKYPGDKEAQARYRDTFNTAYRDRLETLLDSTKDQKITWWGQTYQKAKESELLLGLDLQGGINVTLDVALEGLITGLANNPKDPQLQKAIVEAQRRKLTSDQNFIDLFGAAFPAVNPGAKLAPHFANTNRNKLSITASDDQVITYLRQQANDAMAQTYQVLQRRIDKFGVAQPNINLDENKGIITVELAGATDAERVRRYLQSTANLQFWEVYTLNEPAMINGFQNGLKAIENYTRLQKASGDTTSPIVPTATSSDTNGNITSSAVADSIAIANQVNNPFLQIFQPASPYTDETGRQRFGAVLGYASLKDTSRINEFLRLPAFRSSFPSNAKFLWGKQERDEGGKMVNFLPLYAIETVPGKDGARLEGEAIESADQGFDPITNDVLVNMSMNTAGARTWASMTERSARDGRPIAIVLDDIVYSAPIASEKIEGGNSRITMGRGSSNNRQLVVEEAQDLANILKAGKLEAPARIVQEQVVGPTLGEEAVSGGFMSFIISFGIIFILMIVYYNTAGIIANIALILNLLFTVGILSALNATLTAAGIAGLVLTIGMAVDTNVIIFERIKDELGRGASHEAAVKAGYRRSLPPVLDAHITSLLTAIILAIYGLGPVLGFATTQILGLSLSLFTGILVSRLITDFYTNKDRHFKYFTSFSQRIFRHANYQFIKYRKIAYVISGIIFVLGIAAFFNGFKQGVEFSGGRSYVVKFTEPKSAEDIRNALQAVFPESPVIKSYGVNNDQFDITTDYLINQEGLRTDSVVRNTLFSGLQNLLPAGTTAEQFASKHILQTKRVDPTISDDLKTGAKWATFWSVLVIALYIFLRFRDWRYSMGTLVALMHDVLVTLIVFSFFKNIVPFPLEIDQHFIAAILTVIGFSMNDTVIVYDRIREDSRNNKGGLLDKATIINNAINKTLSRTIMTSFTVFLTILTLFLVGGEVTKGFAFAMLIGIITGSYSSIFVAAPILVDLGSKRPLGVTDLESQDDTRKKKPVMAK